MSLSRHTAGAAALVGLAGLSAAPAFLSLQAGQGRPEGWLRSSPASAAAPAQGAALPAAAAAAVLGAFVAAAGAPSLTRGRKAVVACRAFDASTQVGVTAPFGFFDPAGITKNVDEKEFNRLRSSELRHGRGAMMGALGLTVQSVYKLPGYENVPSGLSAQWTEPANTTLVIIFFLIGCLEIGLSPWKENPANPGDYGDPLNLGNYSVEMRNKELNNGRMAMFAVLGLVSAELYSGKAGMGQFALARARAPSGQSTFCGASRQAAPRSEQSARKAFDASKQVGATAPLGFFDPLGFTKDVDQEGFNRLRSAELRHARGAMMGALGLAVQSVAKLPGFENVPSGLGAQWTEPASTTLGAIFFFIGFLELGLSPWKENPASPGDYGDPLKLGNYSVEMRNKELNNGRVAMFAFLGLVSAEQYSGQVGLSQFALACTRSSSNHDKSAFCGASRQAASRSEQFARKAFDGSSLPGASAPLGYFDPLKLSTTQERFDNFRISELKNGRVAMLAILGSIAHHWGHAPGAESVPAGMAGFSDPVGQKGVVALVLACGFLELGPWADRFAKAPGNYGDPAQFGAKFGGAGKEMETKEINNGRLAMLAVIGQISAELVTGGKVTDLPGQLGL